MPQKLGLTKFKCFTICFKIFLHLFSQNSATNTENSAQSRSEHIFMELTLFVYNINSQYFCIKSGLNYLRYKRYKRNETEGNIFFCNLNFHRNGILLVIQCFTGGIRKYIGSMKKVVLGEAKPSPIQLFSWTQYIFVYPL